MKNRASLTRNLMTACSILALSAVMYGCTHGGDDAAPATDVPDTSDMDTALGAAQMAAMTAATAAGTAADAATAAVMAVEGSMDLTATATAAFARAEDARDDAGAALVAAVAANIAAQAATTSADAEMYQADAEAAQRAAEAAQMSAMAFAGIVSGIQQTMDDAADEATMLADAKAAAMTAAGAARLAADEAQGVADAVALITGPHSGQVIAAQAAAAAAEMAAQAAEAASARAQDDTESADAMDEQLTAVGAQGTAEAQLAEAKSLQSTAQVVADAIAADKEATALAGAMTDARMYADAAKGHYEAAKGKAAAAGIQATMAREAANKAKAARSDYATANTKATEAEAAATRAEAAVPIAMQAMMDADSAATSAEAAETSADAGMYRDQAKTANDTATEQHTGATGAGMAYMAARDANMAAQTAATVHVLSLLKSANALGVMDDPETEADEHAAAVMGVASAIGTAAGVAGNGGTDSMAVVNWDADVAADPEADPAVEAMDGLFEIVVTTVSGTDLDFRTAALEDNPETEGVNESITMPRTATKIDALPGFRHGYAISDGDTHAIVFSDKKQATPEVPAETVTLVNQPVQLSRIIADEDETVTGAVGNLATSTTYDHDGSSDTLSLTGTYTCLPADSCTIQVTDGKVVAVLGTGQLLFSTTGPQDTVALIAANVMADYLAFGVWLDQDSDNNAENGRSPAFAAFADGGTAFVTPEALTGTAIYRGAATGLYTAGSSVDYFQGAATLTAKFGMFEEGEIDAVEGTVTGKINNIVAGGVSMTDVISLNTNDTPDTGNIDTEGAFDGNVRMGAPNVVGDVVSYTYNGSWGGQFYGTPETGEGANPLPPAAAGTFGVSGMTGEGDSAVTRSYVGAFGAHR